MLNLGRPNHSGASNRKYVIGCGVLVAIVLIYILAEMWWLTASSIPVARERLVIPEADAALLVRLDPDQAGLKALIQSVWKVFEEKAASDQDKQQLEVCKRIGRGDGAQGAVALMGFPIEAAFVAVSDPATKKLLVYQAISLSKYANTRMRSFKYAASDRRKNKPDFCRSYKGYSLLIEEKAGASMTMVANTMAAADSVELLQKAVDRITSDEMGFSTKSRLRKLYDRLSPDSQALFLADNSHGYIDTVLATGLDTALPELPREDRSALAGLRTAITAVSGEMNLPAANRLELRATIEAVSPEAAARIEEVLSAFVDGLVKRGLAVKLAASTEGSMLRTEVALDGVDKLVIERFTKDLAEQKAKAEAAARSKEQTSPPPSTAPGASGESPKKE